MKSSELIIGNYLNKSSGNGFFEVTLEDLQHIESGSKCKPIPLTEEWLLKFGFKEDGVWIHKIKNISHNRLIGIDLNNNHIFLSQYDANKHFRDVFINKCEYVHQLQNLYFALTNEELTIKTK